MNLLPALLGLVALVCMGWAALALSRAPQPKKHFTGLVVAKWLADADGMPRYQTLLDPLAVYMVTVEFADGATIGFPTTLPVFEQANEGTTVEFTTQNGRIIALTSVLDVAESGEYT